MENADKIVGALHQLSVETGSLACMGCGREHNCGTHGCAILRTSANLHEQQQTRIAELEAQLAASQRETQAAVEDLENAEIAIESACTLLTPRPDVTISAESARQILFDYGEPREAMNGATE